MALQKDYGFCGITIPSAYLRVDSISWSKGRGLSGTVVVLANANSDQAITSFGFDGIDFDTATGDGILSVVYQAIKQLPETTGAIDV